MHGRRVFDVNLFTISRQPESYINRGNALKIMPQREPQKWKPAKDYSF
jgi:hypothetical protein